MANSDSTKPRRGVLLYADDLDREAARLDAQLPRGLSGGTAIANSPRVSSPDVLSRYEASQFARKPLNFNAA